MHFKNKGTSSPREYKKKIPQFHQIRKNFYGDNCPPIKMSFSFLNKEDQSITRVNVDHTPMKEFERNPTYQKLFEEAHIEVTMNLCSYDPTRFNYLQKNFMNCTAKNYIFRIKIFRCY